MLQKLGLDNEHDGGPLLYGTQPLERDQRHLLSPSFYWQILKRRAVVFFGSSILVLTAGTAAAILWPPTYYAVGRILVESQQIPTELVRPTVTSAAQERIQVIEQRTMTRENLLAIVDKFRLFPEKRSLLSTSQLVELMKKQVKIEPPKEPLVFAKWKARNDNPVVIFNVGFEYSDPETAARVANELVTRILNEDLRDRTSRASDTTKFLYREVQKLQSDITTLDARIAQAKISRIVPDANGNTADPQVTRLAQLKAELVQRGTLYSDKHPMMQSLKRQVEALENSIAQPAASKSGTSKPGEKPADINELEVQRDALQKNLEAASAKLDAARLGEALEKNQQSEKLEVIEQPTALQEPIRPNRPKIMLLALLLAIGAAVSLTFLLEITDRAVRRAADLYGVVDNRLVIVVPYITTTAELHRRQIQIIVTAVLGLVILAAAVFVAVEVLPPLDLIIARIRAGIFK